MGKISIPTPAIEETIVSSGKPDHVGVQLFTEPNMFEEATSKVIAENIESVSEDEFDLEIKILPLKKHFGIDINDTKSNKQLEWLMAWGNLNGVQGRNELMAKIREVEYRIGVDTFGEGRVSNVYNYLKTDMEARESIKRLARMEQNGAKG